MDAVARLAAVALALLAAVPAGAAAAPPWRAGPGEAPSSRAGRAPAAPRAEGLSLDRAVEMVQQRYGARVVRAEERREGDAVVYQIRLLAPDGRVFTVRVDARTGQVE